MIDRETLLATLGPSATLHESPSQTIVPTIARPSTNGARALALIDELAGAKARDAPQLQLGKVIAEGGMGVIREAIQVALGRVVAVKQLKASRREPASALDLLREAWVTGALEHPSIVPVHALELDGEGMPSIVLKRIAGVEWSRLLNNAAEVQRRFGAKDLLAWNLGILLRVLDALRFAHSHGILHRDLKPSNVMIGDFGEVYLLDWGLAVSLRDDGTGRLPLASAATEIAGTPCYMAPEMLGREYGPGLSERTDVYLAGAVLYELVVGHPPHTGATVVEVLAKVVSSRPQVPETVSPELARICTRAMHEDPAERFASIAELHAAVTRHLEHRGSMQLVERASERLAKLRDLLAGEGARARDDVYRLFGACRYGFRDALVAWPENEDAQRGLTAATLLVAEYELAADRPQAAVTLLGELDEPPPLLATAKAAAHQQALRVAELERLGRQHDANIGKRTRAFLMLVMGTIFVVFPLVIDATPALRNQGIDGHLAFAVIMMALTFGAWYWARESMMATLFNRRLISATAFMFFIQGVLAVGTWRLGIPLPYVLVLDLFLYAVISGMLVLTVEAAVWPGSLGYTIAFVVAAGAPERVYQLMSLANVVFTANALYVWWPAQIRFTPEERARRARK